MYWTGSIAASVLSAVVGGGGGLALAACCVKWYEISSFEGKSGFFMCAITLAGVLCGAILGLIAARVAVSNDHASIGPQILAAVGTMSMLLVLATMFVFAMSGGRNA